jgi:hypothetical protein
MGRYTNVIAEIFKMVLNHFPTWDLKDVSLTCKTWYKIAREMLWAEPKFARFPLSMEGLADLAMLNLPIKKFRLSYLDFENTGDISQDWFEKVIKYVAANFNLQYFYIDFLRTSQLSIEQIDFMIEHLPVDKICTYSFIGQKNYREIFEHLKQLAKLGKCPEIKIGKRQDCDIYCEVWWRSRNEIEAGDPLWLNDLNSYVENKSPQLYKRFMIFKKRKVLERARDEADAEARLKELRERGGVGAPRHRMTLPSDDSDDEDHRI